MIPSAADPSYQGPSGEQAGGRASAAAPLRAVQTHSQEPQSLAQLLAEPVPQLSVNWHTPSPQR